MKCNFFLSIPSFLSPHSLLFTFTVFITPTSIYNMEDKASVM